MITATDTNVLVDLFTGDAPHHEQSEALIRDASSRGDIILSAIVYAELVPQFGDLETLDAALGQLNARVSPIDSDVAAEAGLRWMQYRRAGGPRARILPDFLIGAHALLRADQFFTRDRGFYDTYFPELRRTET